MYRNDTRGTTGTNYTGFRSGTREIRVLGSRAGFSKLPVIAAIATFFQPIKMIKFATHEEKIATSSSLINFKGTTVSARK